VLGGPMGVYEQQAYPFLRAEMQLIEQALREQKPILGICLGSQLLASVLGAEVRRSGYQEIGWHEITLDPGASSDPLFSDLPAKFSGFHWHGDVFDLPPGAQGLASSALTPLQAFRHGHSAYGLLFHLEITEAIMTGMIQAFADEMTAAGQTAAQIVQAATTNSPALRAVGGQVFTRWAALVN
jgi:GMP synthase (glutamine-hydrolysing)